MAGRQRQRQRPPDWLSGLRPPRCAFLQANFVPELEAELTALRTRADSAEASASQMEEQLKVGGRSRGCTTRACTERGLHSMPSAWRPRP